LLEYEGDVFGFNLAENRVRELQVRGPQIAVSILSIYLYIIAI